VIRPARTRPAVAPASRTSAQPVPEAVLTVNRYTFQALVTLDRPAATGRDVLPPDQTRRMAVKCRHHQTGRITFFNALVTSSGPAAAEWEDDNLVVTIKITGDDALDYLSPGSSLALWLDGTIGHGIVTRRLFWPATV
jgi:hypothetical protein